MNEEANEQKRRLHNLKIWPSFFKDVVDGKKKFEVRVNDRDFKVGDTLVLSEYIPSFNWYTQQRITKVITYMSYVPNTNYVVLELGEATNV